MGTGVGMSFDLDALDKAIVKADNNLRKLAQDAEAQSKRISDAFSIGAAKGISQFAKEIANARGGISKLMAEGAEFKFTANGAKGFSAKVIDEINKVINYSRKEFENLNATITRSMLIKPTLDVNSIKELENRLVILNQGLATGMLGQGKGKKKIAVDDDLRVRINDEIKAINERLSILRMSTAQFNQMKAQEATAIINNVKLEQEAIEAGKRRAQEAIQNYKRELDAARNSYRERKQMYEQLFKEQEKQMSQNRRASYNLSMKGGDAFASADNAIRYTNRLYSEKGLRNINNMNLAIQKMQQAQQRLNLNTEQGRQKYEQLDKEIKRVKGDIDRVTGASENLNKSHKGLLDTSGQLARALAAVFSVSAIKGYVNKLMQIRGEFELQQRSLQVLLQNKDEANALWDKTVSLAVKSPYTTKQLVTATKQLAAYRIESEKLYETNKMLADVSIGLGVDMNRLILAFGQVKAANFLRGTELRQFSEAGVNMLDELAKRFTALEGRAVSVGEVFERVSKRMVSFADVEAVFKTITSEGGVFYQMQEKQSETLKGMMLNLKDSYELMLNDIGKSNEGMLKGFVSMMKSIVDNWRDLAPFINTAGVALITYFGTGVLKGIAKYSAMILNIWKAHPFLAVASVLATVVTYIISAKNAVDELTAAMREVEKNVTESLEESIGLYRKLTDTINDSTASIDERNKAYEELKTKFKDILPDQLTELKYIESLSFNYKAAEDAMLSYYNAKAIEQKKDKIEGIYEGDFDRDTKDLLEGYNTFIKESGRFTAEQQSILKRAVLRAVTTVVEDAKSGKIAAEYSKIVTELNKRIEEYSGVDFKMPFADDAGVRKVTKNIGEIITSLLGYKQALSDIEGLSFETEAQREAYNQQEAFKEEMDTATRYFKDLVALRQKIADNKIDLTTPDTKLNEEQLSKRTWYLNSIQNIYNALVKDVPQYANKIKELDKTLLDSASKGAYEYKLALGGIENELFNVFAENAKSLSSADEGAQAMLENFAEGIKVEADSKLATPLMEAITSAFNKAINDKDLSQKGKDLLAKLLPDEKQSTGDVRKMVEALLTQYRDEVKKWENATTAGATSLPLVEYLNQFGDKKFKSAMGMYLGSDAEFYELQQKVIPVLEHIDRLLGGDPDKDKKGRSRDLVDERLRVIKEIYKAYKELNKTFDETTSKTGAMKKFGDAFYSAFGKTPEEMGYNLFTAEGVVDAYNKFISTLSKADDITKGNLAKGEYVMDMRVEVQKESDQRFADQIEQMFSGYELSLELEKLNIPRELAESLFDVDTFDLSDIRTKLEQELYRLQTAGGGKDQIKQIQEFLKKVSQMEQKEQEERLKKYIAFSRKAMSERAKIKLEELQTIAEIEKTFAIKGGDSEEVKAVKLSERTRALAQARKDASDALQKLDWEAFKSSDTFNNIFDDLEHASDEVLKNVIQQLKDFKNQWKDMPFEQMRQVVDLLNKAEGALEESSNPFMEGTRLNKIIRKDGRTAQEAQLDIWQAEQQKRIAEEALSNYEIFEKVSNGQLKVAELSTEQQKEYAYWQALSAEQREELVGKIQDEVSAQNEAINKSNIHLNNIKKQKSSYEAQAQAIEQMNQMAQDLYNSFKGLHEALGGDSDSPEAIFAEMGMSVTNSVASMIQLQLELQAASVSATAFGAAMNTALGVIGWINMGVSVLTSVITAFTKAHDNKREKQIQKELDLVERLGKLYEKLEKQIEAAYSIDTFQAANDAAKENLEQQIRATERMIEAEKDKKKTDQKRIEEWREQIEENLEMLEELEAKRLEELGGIGGEDAYKDIAQEFTDAWFDAFLETGDGLDALNDHFDEVLNNMVKKQLALRATNSFLAPIFEEIDKAVKDTRVTNEEMQNIKELAAQTMPELAAFLENIATEMGMSEYTGKNGELSGLSAGIQGITSEQSDILASYLNSIRFYVADSNTQLKALVAAQGVNADTPNPMLSQLLVIAEQTRSIRDMFESVIGRGGNNKHGGAYLKVDIG